MLWYGAPSIVSNHLGPVFHWAWVGYCILGPILVGIGDGMVYSGERKVLNPKTIKGGGGRIYWGWYLQTGGDIIILNLFLTYAAAVFQAAWLQRGVFAAFIVSALGICTVVLIVRGIRRIKMIGRV